MIPSCTRNIYYTMDKPQQVFRLNESQLEALEKQLSPLLITPTCTELQVAGRLGEQRVIQLLRRGFTIRA